MIIIAKEKNRLVIVELIFKEGIPVLYDYVLHWRYSDLFEQYAEGMEYKIDNNVLLARGKDKKQWHELLTKSS
jgi:hypothetical protein